jgi:hypothetical protein
MTAALVEVEQQEHGGYNPVPGVQIIGQNVSSLHRLKDISNEGELCPTIHTLMLPLKICFTRQMEDSSFSATYLVAIWDTTGCSSIYSTSTSKLQREQSTRVKSNSQQD